MQGRAAVSESLVSGRSAAGKRRVGVTCARAVVEPADDCVGVRRAQRLAGEGHVRKRRGWV